MKKFRHIHSSVIVSAMLVGAVLGSMVHAQDLSSEARAVDDSIPAVEVSPVIVESIRAVPEDKACYLVEIDNAFSVVDKETFEAEYTAVDDAAVADDAPAVGGEVAQTDVDPDAPVAGDAAGNAENTAAAGSAEADPEPDDAAKETA